MAAELRRANGEKSSKGQQRDLLHVHVRGCPCLLVLGSPSCTGQCRKGEQIATVLGGES